MCNFEQSDQNDRIKQERVDTALMIVMRKTIHQSDRWNQVLRLRPQIMQRLVCSLMSQEILSCFNFIFY